MPLATTAEGCVHFALRTESHIRPSSILCNWPHRRRLRRCRFHHHHLSRCRMSAYIYIEWYCHSRLIISFMFLCVCVTLPNFTKCSIVTWHITFKKYASKHIWHRFRSLMYIVQSQNINWPMGHKKLRLENEQFPNYMQQSSHFIQILSIVDFVHSQ